MWQNPGNSYADQYYPHMGRSAPAPAPEPTIPYAPPVGLPSPSELGLGKPTPREPSNLGFPTRLGSKKRARQISGGMSPLPSGGMPYKKPTLPVPSLPANLPSYAAVTQASTPYIPTYGNAPYKPPPTSQNLPSPASVLGTRSSEPSLPVVHHTPLKEPSPPSNDTSSQETTDYNDLLSTLSEFGGATTPQGNRKSKREEGDGENPEYSTPKTPEQSALKNEILKVTKKLLSKKNLDRPRFKHYCFHVTGNIFTRLCQKADLSNPAKMVRSRKSKIARLIDEELSKESEN